MVTPTSLILSLQFCIGDTLAPYLFIICVDHIQWMLIGLKKENVFTFEKMGSRWIPQKLWWIQTL